MVLERLSHADRPGATRPDSAAAHADERIACHEVEVRVDEAGQHGDATEIDRGRARRRCDVRSNLHDAIAANENRLIGDQRSGARIEEATHPHQRRARLAILRRRRRHPGRWKRRDTLLRLRGRLADRAGNQAGADHQQHESVPERHGESSFAGVAPTAKSDYWNMRVFGAASLWNSCDTL